MFAARQIHVWVFKAAALTITGGSAWVFTAPESNHREEEEESEAGSLGLTCISSSFDWMSGGKSAAPQVNGSNGSAPNRSLSAKRTQVLENRKFHPLMQQLRPPGGRRKPMQTGSEANTHQI